MTLDFREYFQNMNLAKPPRLGLHYEQKTTPDLLWCVAQAILDITKDDRNRIFSDATDVRNSQLFKTLIQDYFSKPPPDTPKAQKEYDKLSRYQLGLLVFTGILEKVGARPSSYRVTNYSALEEIATNDFSAARFLGEYTEKFLADNGLRDVFNSYKLTPNQANHELAKEAYWEWAREHTAVRGTDRKHTYRVFNKIFNIFCYKNRIPGESGSNITTGPCPYSFLIYNRENFRDKDKPQGMTRAEYLESVLEDAETGGFVEALLKKAKDSVRNYHGNDSEVRDVNLGYAPDRVLEVHHILPRHSYQQFSLTKENLIVLTPDQHRSFAHNGKYRTINQRFQVLCLLVKLENISESLRTRDSFYDLKEFISILNTCYGWQLSIDSTTGLLRAHLDEKLREFTP